MNRLLGTALCMLSLFSCESLTQKSGGKAVNPDGSPMQEGKDYVILKRFRVVDNQGFSQPLEVSSFLLPASWSVSSEVNWNASSKCLPDMLQASVQAISPEKEYELFVYPATQFDWSDDPIYLDAMQKGFVMHSCTIAEPQDAAGYISRTLAPYVRGLIYAPPIR